MDLDLFNTNSDPFIAQYEKIYSRVVSSYLDLNETIRKYTGAYRHTVRHSSDNPESFPASVHDIGNYVARYGIANFQNHIIMRLAGRLDFETLSRSVRLSIDAEPVLGCRFVLCNAPYWKRIDNLDAITFCSMEEAENPDLGVKGFFESPLDMDRDPMIKVRLVRTKAFDTLCLKINHTCCDGGGIKEYVQLLSEIYNTLDRGDTYEVKPRIAGRKDEESVLEQLGIKDPKTAWKPMQDIPRSLWPFPWKYVRSDSARYSACKLPEGFVAEMSRFAKARGATINDLILTAYYRAMFEYCRPLYNIPLDMASTVDLRRYLKDSKAEAIRNFSGGFVLRLPRIKNESFENTLARVTKATGMVKSGNPGAQTAIGGEIARKLDFVSYFNYLKLLDKVAAHMIQFPLYVGNVGLPTLSNMGILLNKLIGFGSATATDAYIIPPCVRAPGFFLVAGTYNDIMTLSTSWFKGTIHRKDAEKLLDMIKTELVEGCR